MLVGDNAILAIHQLGILLLLFGIIIVIICWGQCDTGDTSASDWPGTRPLRTGDSQLGPFAAQVGLLDFENIKKYLQVLLTNIPKYQQIFAGQVGLLDFENSNKYLQVLLTNITKYQQIFAARVGQLDLENINM